MQPGEALGVAAQIAVTLVGFAGIVVVFRPDAVHQWSNLDKLRLRLLLSNSVFPLVYSVCGILLLSVDPPLVWIWRWCSGFVLVVGIGSSALARRQFAGVDFSGVTKLLFYPVIAVGTIAFLFQFLNIFVWGRFWPFFVVICFHLVTAVIQFLRIVLLGPEGEKN